MFTWLKHWTYEDADTIDFQEDVDIQVQEKRVTKDEIRLPNLQVSRKALISIHKLIPHLESDVSNVAKRNQSVHAVSNSALNVTVTGHYRLPLRTWSRKSNLCFPKKQTGVHHSLSYGANPRNHYSLQNKIIATSKSSVRRQHLRFYPHSIPVI